jgi:hypothetical protein
MGEFGDAPHEHPAGHPSGTPSLLGVPAGPTFTIPDMQVQFLTCNCACAQMGRALLNEVLWEKGI